MKTEALKPEETRKTVQVQEKEIYSKPLLTKHQTLRDITGNVYDTLPPA
jgi:hypothetical protein